MRDTHANCKTIIATAEALGFAVTRTRGGHHCALHVASGARVYFATTSCSPSGARNAVALLRRTARQADLAGGPT